MRSLSVIAALGLCLLVAPQLHAAPTQAETDSSAEEHSRRGVQLYAEGKLPEAVREMLKAYELAPESGLLYNIARIYQKMGQRDLAIHYLKQFVTQPGADPDTVQKALKHLEMLKNTTTPPRAVAPAPAPARAPAPAPAPAPAAPAPAPEASSDNTLALITLSAGGAALLVGGVLGGLALGGDLTAPNTTLEDKRAIQDDMRSHALGADICFGVGLAAATAGLVMLLVSGGDDAEASSAAIGPLLGPGQAGAQLMVRFP